jgi:hypothetical protein
MSALDDVIAMLGRIAERTQPVIGRVADVDDDELSRQIETMWRALLRAERRAVALQRLRGQEDVERRSA